MKKDLVVFGSVIAREEEVGVVVAQSKTELRAAAILVVFAFHDTRRPLDEVVHSTDTSTGEGAGSMSGYGGYGVNGIRTTLGQNCIAECRLALLS